MADNRHKLRCAGGKFQKLNNSNGRKRRKCNSNIVIEHNYATCNNSSEESAPKLGKSVSKDGWREGRRIAEFGVLLEQLKYCQYCRLGPVPLTFYNVVGELQKGLGGCAAKTTTVGKSTAYPMARHTGKNLGKGCHALL